MWSIVAAKILIGQLCNAAGVPSPNYGSLPNDKGTLKTMLEEILAPTYTDDSTSSTSSSDESIEPYPDDKDEIAAAAYAVPGLGLNDEINYTDPMNSDVINGI